jgi:hypothetical protein
MDDPVIQLLLKLKGIKWVAYIVVFVLVVVGIANFTDALRKIYSFGKDIVAHYQKRKLTDEELKKQSSLLAKDLMEFVLERQKNEPQIDFDNWKESTDSQIKYSTETQNIFFRDYAGKVANIRDEFLKRRLKNENLERFYQHPTNYLGLRDLAASISSLSEKIK